MGTVSYTVYKIGFKEDIMEMLPTNEALEKSSFILGNSKFMEKVIVLVSLENDEKNPDVLIKGIDALAEKLEEGEVAPFVEKKMAKVNSSLFTTYYQTTFEHLPIYLTAQDYERLDEELEAGTDPLFKNLYKNLITPSGMLFKQYIPKDPYMLVPSALKRLEHFQFDNGVVLYKDHFVSKDQTTALMFISLTHQGSDSKKNNEFKEAIEQSISEIKKEYPQLNYEFYGNPISTLSNANQIKQDVNVTITVALVLIIALISYYFKDKFIFLLLLIPLLFGFGTALIALYFFKSSISLIAIGMGAIIIGISIDFSLHVLTHYRVNQSAEKVVSDLATPLLLSAGTTSISFMCLNFLKAKAMNDLGVFVAISIIISALVALIVLPVILDKLKPKVTSAAPQKKHFLDKIANYHFENNKGMVALLLGFVFVCFFYAGDVKFDAHLDRFNYNSPEVQLAEERINRINPAMVSNILLASEGESLDDAIYQNFILQSSLDSLKKEGFEFDEMLTSTLLIPSKIQIERIIRWKQFWTEERIEKLKEGFAESGKPYGFRANTFDPFWASLEKEYKVFPVEEQIKVFSTLVDDFVIEAEDYHGVTSLVKTDGDKKKLIPQIQALSYVDVVEKQSFLSQIIDMLHSEFDVLVSMSSIVVLLLLLITFGRIELTLICYLPIIMSWVMTLGIMGMFDIRFNIFNVIISTFIFGIGIDYSIFITKGLQENTIDNTKEHLPIYKSSILLSSITTLLGIGAMFFAQHPSLRSIGLLTIIGIVSVLMMTFIFQPLLFKAFISVRTDKGKPPVRFLQLLKNIIGYSIFVSVAQLITLLSLLLFFPGLKAKMRQRKLLFHTILCYFFRGFLNSPMFEGKIFKNFPKEDLKGPSVIIANHQSFLDIFLVLAAKRKAVLVTNSWVYNSPIFGRVVRKADYLLADEGIGEEQLTRLKSMVEDGYSIIVFPEGTRSKTGALKRFHKGAFLLAEQLQLDILPMMIHGTHRAISKSEFYYERGDIRVSFLPKIKYEDRSWGDTYQARTKAISKYFKKEYLQLCEELETVDYFRKRVLSNYLYKGPVTEWYVRIKLMLEDNFRLFESLLPKEGVITDLGCGLGYTTQMLAYMSEKRQLLGIDYDEEKIRIANSGVHYQENIHFESGNIKTHPFPASDVFIISDVLHYLPKEEQIKVVKRCLSLLKPNGFLIVRDGDKDEEQKQKKTKLAEVWSTEIIKFNKVENELEYISKQEFSSIIDELGYELDVIPMSKITSNSLYLIREKETKATWKESLIS
ncbi:trifunctional MMPL family transporter/lysophospholipid acyltransferase/class I SAM-dependent methyltransferase [Flammeovirga sp. SJP92]|uniref:trifunctional MMPL family transporter/lysophospholipid acyltransferase/class I SAM-dependent methyltransferase n=1 Tax=Flammeovirga sp. SJP92 TaxID=1775430 RepID=UPI00078811DD|nr:trifunctional MMPL family transporter/lysophospholipid acyltransferase/class I SAM-dependent methyltransferase [Flammeovirga sp. SJP92]KXX71685.1 hypothetical protein AVL50_05270 [Flammeovirga sp. SJP92]